MILLVDSDPGFNARVAGQLGRSDLLEVRAVEDLERILAERTGTVDVVILGPSVPAPDALGIAERVQARTPDVSVVFVAPVLSSDLLQQALRAGVRDILPASYTPEQLAGAVERSETLSRQMKGRAGGGEGEDDGPHRVVTVFSSKGGVGKSFVAANLAVVMARRTGAEVALVDLDLQFGDLAIMLQLFPARTLYDAAQNLAHLDEEALRGYMSPHDSGVRLLAAPLEPGLAETISAEAVQRIIQMLRQTYRTVVVDTPAAFTDHVVAALDESDHCVLLTSMDVPSIKNQKLALQTLDLLGVGRERIRLGLNRADSEVGLRVQEVEKTLATRVDVSIPSSRDVPLSVNRGLALAKENPGHAVVQALGRLADTMDAPAEQAGGGAERGRRFLRRKAR